METKRMLAVHEAGHILLAHLFPRYDWHAFSQLLPGGKVEKLTWGSVLTHVVLCFILVRYVYTHLFSNFS